MCESSGQSSPALLISWNESNRPCPEKSRRCLQKSVLRQRIDEIQGAHHCRSCASFISGVDPIRAANAKPREEFAGLRPGHATVAHAGLFHRLQSGAVDNFIDRCGLHSRLHALATTCRLLRVISSRSSADLVVEGGHYPFASGTPATGARTTAKHSCSNRTSALV